MLAVGGVLLSNLALRAGSLPVAQSTLTLATPFASTLIGVGVFGENLEISPVTAPIGIAAAAVAVFGVVPLARSPSVAAAAPVVPTPA